MALLQLKCETTGKFIDIQEVPLPEVSPQLGVLVHPAVAWGEEIPCPHCGETHLWTSSQWVQALEMLHESPNATRLVIDGGHVSADVIRPGSAA